MVAPPPFIYLAGLVLLLGLDWLAPFALGLGSVGFGLGGVLLVAGCAVNLWGVYTLLRHRTAVHPTHAASELVTSGPFAWSRNPLYVGLNAIFLGVTAIADTGWGLVVFVAVVAIMHFGVIRPEEAHLRARFGDAFEAYCDRVRRYL